MQAAIWLVVAIVLARPANATHPQASDPAPDASATVKLLLAVVALWRGPRAGYRLVLDLNNHLRSWAKTSIKRYYNFWLPVLGAEHIIV